MKYKRTPELKCLLRMYIYLIERINRRAEDAIIAVSTGKWPFLATAEYPPDRKLFIEISLFVVSKEKNWSLGAVHTYRDVRPFFQPGRYLKLHSLYHQMKVLNEWIPNGFVYLSNISSF